MPTHRQRLTAMRTTLLSALDTHLRSGEQLGSVGTVGVGPHHTWFGQANLLFSMVASTNAKQIVNEKGWHAPIATDADRASEILQDVVALREALAVLRAEQDDTAHALACADVEQILMTFEAIVRRLAKRREKREPLAIEDEYDVHYLLQALLAIHFKDVRTEEAVPSLAGANSRIDFFLKADKIAIEAKATRASLDDQQLGREMLDDLAKYKGHGGVKTLYFFVWDPHHYISNSAGIASDIKQEAGERPVRIIFSPPRR